MGTSEIITQLLDGLRHCPDPVFLWGTHERAGVLESWLRAGVVREISRAEFLPSPDADALAVRETATGLYGVPRDDGHGEIIKLEMSDVKRFQVDPACLGRCIAKQNGLIGGRDSPRQELINLGRMKISGRGLADLWLFTGITRFEIEQSVMNVAALTQMTLVLCFLPTRHGSNATFPKIPGRDFRQLNFSEFIADDFKIDLEALLAVIGPVIERGFSLNRNGKLWEIKLDGVGGQVPHSIGMGYIEYLTDRAGQAVHATDLANAFRSDGQPIYRRGEGLAQEVSPENRAKLESALHDTEEGLKLAEESGEDAEIEELRKRREKFQDALKKAQRYQGRSKESGDDKKARVAVTNAINRAIATIRKAYPVIANHLDASISRGQEFFYTPAQNGGLLHGA